MLALAEKFLAKHLGGRYQESVTPEVAKRLQEITVDPKTVQLATKPAANGSSPGARPWKNSATYLTYVGPWTLDK